jgi:hypothetical protein
MLIATQDRLAALPFSRDATSTSPPSPPPPSNAPPAPLGRPPLKQLSPPAKRTSGLQDDEKHSGREERVGQTAGEEEMRREKEDEVGEEKGEEKEEEKEEEEKEETGHRAAIDKLEAAKHHFGSSFSSPEYCLRACGRSMFVSLQRQRSYCRSW